MKNMYIKWPAYLDDAGIRTELEESDPIKKLDALPKRQARREFCNDGGWDKPYRDHSFWHTENYRKAKAIINASVNSSIQKVREKLKPLIPSHENIEDFLDWNYDKEREDGKIVGINGYISDKPDRNFKYYRAKEKWYNIEGLIKGPKKNKPQHHFTKEEKIARHASKLEARAKILAKRAEDKRYADFYFYFRNLPKDLQETRTKDRNYTYWRLLCYIYNIDRAEQSYYISPYSRRKYYGITNKIKETSLTEFNKESILERMNEVEMDYFEKTGLMYRKGERVYGKKVSK